MKSSLWFMLLLAGCEMTRPYGSYNQPDSEPEDAAPTGFADGDAGRKGGSDASVKIPRRDGATDEPWEDVSDPSSPLAPYTGTYLMRMDMFSSAEASALDATLRVKNRISNLLLADVRVEGGELVSRETLCHETFTHECTGCTGGWRTTPDENLPKFFPRASATRTVRVTDGKVEGDLAMMAVGFDADDVSASTTLPTSLSDQRLWRLAPDDPKRVGLRTRLQTQISIAKFDCVITAVQRFASRFVGAPSGDEDSPLEGVDFALETPGLDGASLHVEGEPALVCNQEILGKQAAPEFGKQYVRFKRTELRDRCPSIGVFDAELPPERP